MTWRSEDTLAYVRCEDEEDEHYEELKAMEEEIKEFTRANGEPFRNNQQGICIHHGLIDILSIRNSSFR
uniref:agmatine deiminase family protein n=1 Tax=Parabacteroides distasonis TaxID=823 RepID=UPI00374DFEF9